MKVAIIHDYIKEYGGAERVLEALLEIWPEATVYTTIFLPDFLGPHKERFNEFNIKTSWMQNIPFVHKLISPIRILTPWFFENLNLMDFDLVIISATGAYIPNLIVSRADSVHICYCHTPPRYLYGYPTARNWRKTLIGRISGELANYWLRKIDFLAAQRPDYFIANSHETRRRIAKFYRREATVIYPPVDISGKQKAESGKDRKSYYLAGGRLARAKRIDLAIEACNRLRLPLKVFGRGFADYDDELRQMAGETVEFVGEINDSELAFLYKGAKALIYPSEYEDFGIIPVEAQGFGIPVIALRQGGLIESVRENKTGVFFEETTVESVIAAIKKFEKKRFSSHDCIENAKRFNKERFKKEIKDFVHKVIK